ncbi:MAG: hypothetical protein KBS99_07110 [Prevotellaceae bacterium]|nr:hypothetical protein [Candidatus Colivivens caballi]
MGKNYQKPKTVTCSLMMNSNLLGASQTPPGEPTGEYDTKSKNDWVVLNGDEEW